MTDAVDNRRYNAGLPWLEIDSLDLKEVLEAGDTIEQASKHLLRTEDEIREKMRELGLSVKRSRQGRSTAISN